jgi:hypothetical protein
VGRLFGTFSDVGRLLMVRFESGTFHDGTFCMCTLNYPLYEEEKKVLFKLVSHELVKPNIKTFLIETC